MIKEKIINLIPSKTMRDFLLENTEKLNLYQYVLLIAELPVNLKAKKELLTEFQNELSEHQSIMIQVKQRIDFLDNAIRELDNFDRRNGTIILNTFTNRYDKEDFDESNPRKLINSYPVLSFDNALNIVKGNICDNYDVVAAETETFFKDTDNIAAKYYELELYKAEKDKFVRKYTYTMNEHGEVIFVTDSENTNIFKGGNTSDFPTPYKPGDILLIDGRPFFNTEYCVICDEKDMQSIFISKNKYMKNASFKEGKYCNEYTNVIFYAEKVNDELPKKYKGLKILSDIIRKN